MNDKKLEFDINELAYVVIDDIFDNYFIFGDYIKDILIDEDGISYLFKYSNKKRVKSKYVFKSKKEALESIKDKIKTYGPTPECVGEKKMR